jgi:uncharacterized protein YcaQ
MEKLEISLQQARRFLLQHQGLWPPRTARGKAGILAHFERVGCIQFDPLNIVGHNSELVLQARVADFRPSLLQELLYKERQLLDGWDKVMSIYRVQDWPFFQRGREDALRQWGGPEHAIHAVLPQVRAALQERGPLSSLDLNFDQTVDWPWAPTRLSRAALESMYFWGELVIHHRVHTRKVYDLASRHLPADLLAADDPNQNQEEFYSWAVQRRIGGVGLLWNKPGDAWVGIAGLKSRERQAAMERLLAEEKLAEVQIIGWNQPCYLRRQDLPTLQESLNANGSQPQAAILAPLDNLLWDRHFIEVLFNFSYRWEVYKPANERQYGYYVLPVLYGDRFVARFEPGREKKGGALVIKNWWWEADVEVTSKMQSALQEAFRHFLAYLGTNQLRLEPSAQAQNLEWLKQLL